MIVKSVDGWPFTFGGQVHSGWLPTNAALPLPTPVENEVLDVVIECVDGGYFLIWQARPSETNRASGPPKAGDSWHETLAKAEAAAYEWFGIRAENWTSIG
jgi:hypothetical protein